MYTNNEFSTNISSLRGLRVLLVDDNVDFCDVMMLLLQIYGVEAQKAGSAQEALEIFRQWQPDVLLSDIALPNEDGYELIQQIRTKVGERGKSVLAIAVTGYADEKMLKRALSNGFDMWFTKPLNFDEFFAVLGSLALCQKSACAIAQRILGHVPRYDNLSLEKQLAPIFPNYSNESFEILN